MTIHQVYCTHCTHGSSALERGQGELASRMLGYSVRAGSLEGDPMRKFYKRLEDTLYYHLPRDVRGEEKLHLSAQTAPRRFFFVPATDGLQVLGLVCYRATDCEGRPESYFAHLLFEEVNDQTPRWSALDCLKLWDAPGWMTEDSPSFSYVLPTLESLDEMLAGQEPVLSDRMVLSFLRTEANSPLHDPSNLLPRRWHTMDPQQRTSLLTDVLAAAVASGGPQKESLWLAAEPSAAAFFFYSIARLVPAPVRQTLGFSTFETDVQRAKAPMMATWFAQPDAHGTQPEALQGHAHGVNTLLPSNPQQRSSKAQFAPAVIQRMVQRGWEETDRFLANMEAVGANRPEHLDILATVDRMAAALIQRGAVPADSWRTSKMVSDYFRQTVARGLAHITNPTGLRPLLGTTAHLLLIELLAGRATGGSKLAVDYLFENMPPEKFAEMFKIAGVETESKTRVLSGYLAEKGDLPPGCDSLWDEWAPAKKWTRKALAQVVCEMPGEGILKFFTKLPEKRIPQFLLGLGELCKLKAVSLDVLKPLVETADDTVFLRIHQNYGAGFFFEYPSEDPTLGLRLQNILLTLPDHIAEVKERVQLLIDASEVLPTEDDRADADAWAICLRSVSEVGRFQDVESTMNRQQRMTLLMSACREMSRGLDQGMTRYAYGENDPIVRKQEVLAQLGDLLLGGKRLLPPGPWEHASLWERISQQFRDHFWSMDPLKKIRRIHLLSPEEQKRRMVLGAALGGLAVAGGAYWGLNYFVFNKKKKKPAPPAKQPPPSRPQRKV